MMRVAVALPIVVAFSIACAKHDPPKPTSTAVVDAGTSHKAMSVGDVLAILTKDKASVDVSVRDQNGDVSIELKGAGPPSIAFAQLTSLPTRLPDVRATKLVLEADKWSANLVVPAHDESLAPPLVDVAKAAQPVFDALLASGTVDATADHLAFSGALKPGKTIADAGAAVPPGYSIARVDLGAAFALDLKRTH